MPSKLSKSGYFIPCLGLKKNTSQRPSFAPNHWGFFQAKRHLVSLGTLNDRIKTQQNVKLVMKKVLALLVYMGKFSSYSFLLLPRRIVYVKPIFYSCLCNLHFQLFDLCHDEEGARAWWHMKNSNIQESFILKAM